MTKEKLLNLSMEELQQIYVALPTRYTPHRFGYKSFWYGDYHYIADLDIHVRLGQSYSTIVTMEICQFIDGELCEVLYELGKHSTTTSKQVTQFYRDKSQAKTRILVGHLKQ